MADVNEQTDLAISSASTTAENGRKLNTTQIKGRIERRQGTSLSHQVYLVLRDRIMSGRYEPASLLPSEEELARVFSVSRVTVRSAMALLEAEGLIERKQGFGTSVAKTIQATRLHTPVSGVLEHIMDVDRKTELKLIEFDYVKVPFYIQTMFDCDASAVFQRAVRLRSIGSQPVFHITTYLPQNISKEFTREELRMTSIYRLLLRSGIQLHSGHQVVSAQLADPAVAEMLNVSVGSALLQIRRQHYDEQERLIEYFEMLSSPSVFELNMTLDAESIPR